MDFQDDRADSGDQPQDRPEPVRMTVEEAERLQAIYAAHRRAVAARQGRAQK